MAMPLRVVFSPATDPKFDAPTRACCMAVYQGGGEEVVLPLQPYASVGIALGCLRDTVLNRCQIVFLDPGSRTALVYDQELLREIEGHLDELNQLVRPLGPDDEDESDLLSTGKGRRLQQPAGAMSASAEPVIVRDCL